MITLLYHPLKSPEHAWTRGSPRKPGAERTLSVPSLPYYIHKLFHSLQNPPFPIPYSFFSASFDAQRTEVKGKTKGIQRWNFLQFIYVRSTFLSVRIRGKLTLPYLLESVRSGRKREKLREETSLINCFFFSPPFAVLRKQINPHPNPPNIKTTPKKIHPFLYLQLYSLYPHALLSCYPPFPSTYVVPSQTH